MISESLGFIFLIFTIATFLAIWFYREKTTRREKRKEDYILGLKEIVTGDKQKAIKLLRKAAFQDTNNVDAYILLGDLLREAGNLKKALQIHRSVTSRKVISTQNSSRALKSLALDYSSIGDHQKAADVLEKSRQLIDDNWTLKFLIQELEKLNNWEDAFQLLKKLSIDSERKNKHLAHYKVKMGDISAEKEEYHNARILFKDAIRLDKDCKEAYIRVGDAYYAEGRIDDGIDWWNKFSMLFPEICHAVFKRMERAAYEKGDFGEMITFYSKFVREHPDNIAAKIALSRLFERMGRLDDAISILEDIEEKPLEVEIIYLDMISRREKIDGKTREIIDNISNDRLNIIMFRCEECGYKSIEPLWHCPECGSWNSFGI